VMTEFWITAAMVVGVLVVLGWLVYLGMRL
jgi:hypothetical protein